MTLPPGCKRDLERFDIKLQAISKMARNTPDSEYDFKADLHELIQAISHFLDRLMDGVWRRHGKPGTGKKKPNIYFPDCSTESAFQEKLVSLQLGNLKQDAQSIHDAIHDVQSGLGLQGSWLKTLKSLANLKHERILNIEKESNRGLAIGVNQNVQIDRIIFGGDGRIVDFKGHGFNQATGAREPLKIQFMNEIREILELAKCNPIEFARESIGHALRLAEAIHADGQDLKAE